MVKLLHFIYSEGLLGECDKEENAEVSGAALLLEKETVKRFIQCHVFAQTSPGRRPNGKYTVNTSQGSGFL
jgi:hypothetical protein